MLEGLEITILKLSGIAHENEKLRIDSAYFSKEALSTEELIARFPSGFTTLGEISSCFRKGIFDIKADTYTETGVPFVRISNLRNGLIDVTDIACISEEAHAGENKTALVFGDLILSKTAYPTASFVNLDRCNVSQDTIAFRLSPTWEERLNTSFLTSFLNSRYGLTLMGRQFQGNVQLHLSLPDGEKIKVPLCGQNFQKAVQSCFITSFQKQKESLSLYDQAEQSLLFSLGLDTWHPPEPLTYEQPAKVALATGRLDAEYFSPRVQGLLQLLQRQNRTIGSVAELRKGKFDPSKYESFEYIEISDMTGNGEVNSSIVPADEAASRATQHVRKGDVITSTVRPIRRLSALIQPEQDGFVCSSGFAVLHPLEVPTELLLTYLRLPIIAELMDLHTTASMYPAISVPDILNLPFVKPDDDAIKQVVAAVQQSHAARKKARILLERAKRAVEISIEESEEAGLVYLNGGH